MIVMIVLMFVIFRVFLGRYLTDIKIEINSESNHINAKKLRLHLQNLFPGPGRGRKNLPNAPIRRRYLRREHVVNNRRGLQVQVSL
mgnify:CR=1 FL=1